MSLHKHRSHIVTHGLTRAPHRAFLRETIADSVELVVRGHAYDGLIAFAGCDKTLPAMMMTMLGAGNQEVRPQARFEMRS